MNYYSILKNLTDKETPAYNKKFVLWLVDSENNIIFNKLKFGCK